MLLVPIYVFCSLQFSKTTKLPLKEIPFQWCHLRFIDIEILLLLLVLAFLVNSSHTIHQNRRPVESLGEWEATVLGFIVKPRARQHKQFSSDTSVNWHNNNNYRAKVVSLGDEASQSRRLDAICHFGHIKNAGFSDWKQWLRHKVDYEHPQAVLRRLFVRI